MMKTSLVVEENVIVSKYRQNDGYYPKKSEVLSANLVTEFIIEAPDGKLIKKILIFCFFGGMS